MTTKAQTAGMTNAEARRHLKTRTELVFDRKQGPGRGQVEWSVMDAHAARLVLFELDQLKRIHGDRG